MHPRRTVWISGGLLAAALIGCLLLFSWRGRPHGGEARGIRFGYIPFNADVVFFVACEEGYFRDEGLEVEPVRFEDGGAAAKGLLAGKVDMVAPIAYSVQWPLLEQDPDALRMFLPLFESRSSPVSAMLVKSDSPIAATAEFKGRKIGTYNGAPQLLYLKLALRGLGLDPDKDVSIVQVAESLQVTALESGQIDVLFTVAPFVTIAEAQVGARVLVSNPRAAYIVDPFPFGAAAVSQKFLAGRPEDVRKVYRALSRAVARMKSDPLGGRATLPKYTAIDAALAPRTGAYEPFTLDDRPDMGAVQKLADVMFESGILRSKADPARAFVAEGQLR